MYGGEGDDAYTYIPSDDCDVWVEHTDENGYNYYVNESTGESKWEAPEWVEETDPSSGAKYYVKLAPVGANPLHSTWSKPDVFARLNRQTTEDTAYAEEGEGKEAYAEYDEEWDEVEVDEEEGKQ